MPIRLPDLDDRTFIDLVEEMRALIPRYAPETWTDHNVSDPGIMLVELFGWLTEALIYRTNRIPLASRVRFLELLGVDFAPAQPSRIQFAVTAEGIETDLLLPTGTPFVAYGDEAAQTVAFESVNGVALTPDVPTALLQAEQVTTVTDENLGVGNGRAHQIFRLDKSHVVVDRVDPVRTARLIPHLTVGGRRWNYVPTLLDSAPDAEVFTVIPHLNVIHFGDGMPPFHTNGSTGQAGKIPSNGAEIMITYRHTLGQRGNVPADAEFEIDLYSRRLHESVAQAVNELGVRFKVFSEARTAGGLDPTSLAEAHEEAITDLSRRWRAITTADFEHLVLDQPVLNLQRARCVPDVDLTSASDGVPRKAGDVSLIVVPKTESMPEQTFEVSRPIDLALFSPDGASVAIAGAGGETSLWNVESGAKSAMFPREGMVRFAVFSPDGTKLVTSCDDDYAARIWDARSGRQLAVLHHEGSINAVAFHTDGEVLATAGDDGSVRLWNTENGRLMQALDVHTGAVNAVAFDDSGTMLASVGNDGVVNLWQRGAQEPVTQNGESEGYAVNTWEMETKKSTHEYRHDAAVNAVAFSPDGARLVTASNDASARIWKTGGNAEPIAVVHDGPVNAVAFSPDGSSWATASDDRTARLWAVESGEPLSDSLPHGGVVNDLNYSLDGRHLATASDDGTTRVWDVQSGRVESVFSHNGPVNAVTFCPLPLFDLDGQSQDDLDLGLVSDDLSSAFNDNDIYFAPNTMLAVVAEIGGSQWRLDLEGEPAYSILAHDGRLQVYTLSRNQLATASNDGTAQLWDVENRRRLALLRHDVAVNSVAVSPDGQRLATASDDYAARIWDIESGLEMLRVYWQGAMAVTAFSPRGDLVAGADDEGIVRIWSTQDGGQQLALRGHKGSINAIAFAPEEAAPHLVTVGDDSTVRLWDVDSGEEIAAGDHGGIVNSAAFSRDGKWLVTASNDQTAKLWPMPNLGEPRVIDGHQAAVNSAVFSPDGQLVATAGDDNRALVWHLDTTPVQREKTSGGPLQCGVTHNGPVNAVVFSADGRLIATASEDRTARILDIWPVPGKDDDESRPVLRREGAVNTVTFSPDGRWLATGSDDHCARLWSVETGERVSVLPHAGNVNSVTFSPDGRWLATASDDRFTHVWNVNALTDPAIATTDALASVNRRRLATDGELRSTQVWDGNACTTATILGDHTHAVNEVRFSPDSAKLVTSSDDRTAQLYDLKDGGWHHLSLLRRRPNRNAISFCANGARLAGLRQDGSARIWETDGDRSITVQHGDGAINAVAYSPKYEVLATAGSDNVVQLWNVEQENPLAVPHRGGIVNALSSSPDGQLLVAACDDCTAWVWHAATRKRLAILHHNGPVLDVAFDPTGKWLATASDDNFVRLWRVANVQHGINRDAIKLRHGGAVNALAFQPGDNTHWLATACADASAHLWDLNTLIDDKLPHQAAVNAVAFSADGTLLCTAGDDAVAHIWPVDNQERQAETLMGHSGPITAVIFGPETAGLRLATGSDDRTARVWERQGGVWQQLSILRREGSVNDVQFSPDGSQLVVASDDNAARLWHLENETRTALRHDGPVKFAMFSSDGSRLATGSEDNTARIWDVGSGEELLVLEHGGIVTAAIFDSDNTGRHLVTASAEKLIRFWNTHDGQESMALRPEGGVTAIAFSQDGRRMVTGGDDDSARLWDAETGRRTAVLHHQGTVNAVAFSPDDRWLATASDDCTARLWDALTGEQIRRFDHEATVKALAFDRSAGRLATVDTAGIAHVWAVASGEKFAELEQDGDIGHTGIISDVAFSPDGGHLVTAGMDASVIVWALGGNQSAIELRHEGPVHAVAFAPAADMNGHDEEAGAWLATASENHAVHIWPWEGATVGDPILLHHKGAVNDLAFDAAGLLLASASSDKTAAIWSLDGGGGWRKTVTLRHRAAVNSVSFGGHGTAQWLATASDDSSAQVWDVTNGRSLALLPHQAAVQVAVIRPHTDGLWLATASTDRLTWLWPVNLGQSLAVLAEHNGSVDVVGFSPDGKLLATADSDRIVRLWDAKSGAVLEILSEHDGTINGLVFSPDGDQLVTFSADGAAQIWTQGDDGWMRMSVLKHDGSSVYAAAYGSEGALLATASADGKARIWNSLDEIPITLEHDGAVGDVAYGSDGRQLATACDDGVVRIWNVEHRKPLSTLVHGGAVNSVRFNQDGRRLVTADEYGSSKLAADFFDTVWAFLDRRRLVTSRHHIVGAAFADICIRTRVACVQVVDPLHVEGRIRTELTQFFDPLSGGPDKTGWPFGRHIHASEVHQVIESLDEVDHVEMLELRTRGAGKEWREAGSRLNIDPHSLVHLVEAKIEIQRSL